MKKKFLLITMMIAVLICLFAISVGAKTMTYEGKEIEIVDNLGDPSWYTGDTALAIQDKESVVILKDAVGNMTAYPSYYIFKFGVDVKDGAITSVYILRADQKGVDYSFVNEKTGKDYTSGSIYYVEFPYGMTKCMNNSIFGKDADSKPESNVVEIVIPDSVTVIDSQAFRRMNSCKKVTMSKNVTNLVDWAFCGSPKLETVVFPEGCLLESIGNSFKDCTALSSINLEACTKLKTLGSSFSGCTSLRKIALPDSIETIGNQAFYRIGEFELASDYLPKNLKSIGTHFLSGNTVKNEVLYFPEGFTEFSASYHFNDGYKPATSLTLVFLGKMTNVNVSNAALVCFTNNGTKQPLNLIFAKNTYSDLGGDFVQGVDFNGNQGYISKHADGSAPYTVKTGTLIVNLQNNDPNSGAELGNDANGNTVCKAEGAPAKLIFCGGDTVEYSYSVRNNHTDKGWYRFHTTSWTYDLDAHKTANVHYNSIVYQPVNCGYDETTTTTCVICKLQDVIKGALATGEHTCTDDFNCETALNCDVCKKTIVDAISHNIIVEIGYENGFVADGKRIETCENEGCKHSAEIKINPIFVFTGVSTKESDTIFGITLGYSVNYEALEAYEAVNGKLKYGFVVAFASLLGENAPIVNGEKASVDGCNIIMVDVSKENSSYSSVDFVLKSTKEVWENEEIKVGEATLAEAELVMAGYTIDANNGVTYFNSASSNTVQDFVHSYSTLN